MIRYIAGRVGQGIFVIWLAYTLSFFAIEILPSDPITIYLVRLNDDSTVDPNLVEAMKSYYGYDHPLWQRYFNELWQLAHGNFGYALSKSLPVTTRIGQVVTPTIELALTALAFAVVIALSVVSIAVLSKREFVRRSARSFPALLSAIPAFWLGLMALEILSFQLGLMSIFPDGSAMAFFVPAVVLSLPVSSHITQVLLKSVDTVYEQPYIKEARAKGATPKRVFFLHVLKPASAPAITMIGLVTGYLLAGAVIVEKVFSRTGIGSVLEQAVSSQDVALIQGFVLLSATIFVTLNIVVDLIYPLLDPRVIVVHRSWLSRSVSPLSGPPAKDAAPGPAPAPAPVLETEDAR
jgi:peptide/nickel transport system permease protein